MSANTSSQSDRLNAVLDYARKGCPVIPLSGKVPCIKGGHGHKDGTTDEAQIKEWWTQFPDANIGIVTGKRSGLLVLDIDIKKGKRGDESLRELIAEHGSLPKTLQSQTASGGWHYVFRMPDVPVKSRNGVREGIDLLADGKYFVAPTSTIDGKAYEWVVQCEPALCPAWVAALGQGVSAPQETSSEDRISTLIRALFPNGRESNGNWITNCPYQENHDDATPSFDVRLADGVFLCHACEEKGSFAKLYAKVKGVSEEEARRVLHPVPSFVEELNQTHAVIMLGGKFAILNEDRDPVHNWKTITLSSPEDFKLRYGNRPVQVGETYVDRGKAWLKHRDRREYQGWGLWQKRAVPGSYNLWQGFSVKPKPGNCDLMLDHIHMNICSGNAELSRYVMAWMAQAVQDIEERPGTALVLRGNQGTGKGILCVQFGSLFGPHFTHVTHSRHLVGNFNAHLKDALLVFADEAYWAGEKKNIGALKAMVTEDWLAIEYKGRDVVRVQNHVRLMIATNDEWAVPAGFEERRFCVIEVSDKRMQDTAYFEALMKQWRNGGKEAFLDYLLHYDLTGINLRKIPHTDALNKAKLLTMSTAAQFWYEILVRGTIDPSFGSWTPIIKKRVLHDLYIEFAKNLGQPRRSNETVLGGKLRKLCPHVDDRYMYESGKAQRAWYLGDLQQCREAFCRVLNCPNHDWGADPEVQSSGELVCPPELETEFYPVQKAPEGIEELRWEDFAPGGTVSGESVGVPQVSTTIPQPHAPDALAEAGPSLPEKQPNKSRKPRSKQLCNRRSSRGHRPGTRLDTSEGRDIQQASKKQKPKKKGTPCNLHNLKKKPS